MADGRSTGIFHGWIVVGATFTVLFLSFGAAYTFTNFFPSLQAEFGATHAEISAIFGIAGFLYFSLGTISGPLAVRYGPRWVVAFGMVVVGLGLLFGARAQSLWEIYIAYGLGIGIGVGFAYVPSVGAVQAWFVRRRGTASGLAVAGIGVGTLVMPWIAEWLIQADGWRLAYTVFGIAALVGVGAALIVDDKVEARGLRPDNVPAPEPGTDAPAPEHQFTLRQALRARPFWVIYAASFIACIGLFVPFVHVKPYATDHGFPPETGALLLSLIGAGSTAGRFLLGGVADRFGRRRTLMALFAGMGVSYLIWLAAGSVPTLMVFAFLFGTCYGGYVALAPAVMADYFGPRHVAGIIGALYSSVAIGTLLGPTLAGMAYDLFQSYAVPIAASAVFGFGGAALTATLMEPHDWRRRALAAT